MAKKNNQLLMLLSAVGLMAFTACADDKYDLSDIDMTIGVGSDNGLTLPTSSTRLIKLKDMMELEDNESVIIDENDDYVFLQKGDAVDDVITEINKIEIVENKENESTDYPVGITIPGLPVGSTIPEKTKITIPADNTGETNICTIRYEGDKPAEVLSLTKVSTEGSFNVNISFSKDLQYFIKSFMTFEVKFPSYMTIKVSNDNGYTVKLNDNKNVLNIENVSTSKPLEIGVDIVSLDFVEGSNDFLTIDGETINMEGSVIVNASWDESEVEVEAGKKIEKLELTSHMRIKGCYIVSATGNFNPEIGIHDLGNATIGELPDFLTNEGVVLDLDNPQIIININSKLPVPGSLQGRLRAKDENGVVKDKEGKEIELNTGWIDIKEGENKIVICKYKNTPAENCVEKPEELASIIENLSKIDSLSFEAEAKADASAERTIKLGYPYTIKPSYSIEAPIAFGERASIVYKDTLDGWNDDLQDLEFQDGAYLQVEADIENRIPAYLSIDAYAIGVDGKKVDDVTVNVDKTTIAAYTTEEKLKPTKFNITIKSKNALEKVDGIVFSIKASASAEGQPAVTGVTLNAQKHGLTLKNIKVTIKGKVVIKGDD